MQTRLNASDIEQAGSFLQRELLKRVPKIYEKKYARLWAEEAENIPVVGTLEGYERQVEAEIFEAAALATEYGDRTSDIRVVSSSIATDKYNVHCYAVAVEYGIKEMHARKVGGRNIETKQIAAASRSLKQKVHNLLCFGDAKRNSFGLYNDPNITPIVTSYDPNTATWQDHVDFFTDNMATIADNNELTEGIRYIYLPNKLRAKLATTYQAGDSGKSALEAIMDGNSSNAGGSFDGFIIRNECKASLLERFGIKAAGTNEDRIVFIPRNEDVINRMSGTPDMMPTQIVDMVYRTIFFYSTSECIIQYPDAMAYADVPQIL